MRRSLSDLPFTGHATRRARVPDDDRQVTYHRGRGYLDESSIRDPNHVATPEEQKVLRQRQLEAAQDQQADVDANFAAVLRLGAALKVLKGEV